MRPLTEKQLVVLKLIAERRTIIEIAHQLGVSQSAINQRISNLKRRFGVNSLRELALCFEQYQENQLDKPCSSPACNNSHLPRPEGPSHFNSQGDPLVLADSLEFHFDSPWAKDGTEPQVVPRVLDGENAGWLRGAAIALIVASIFAAIILCLAAESAISEMLYASTAPATKTNKGSSQSSMMI